MQKLAIWCLVLAYALFTYGCLETTVNNNADGDADDGPALGDFASTGCKTDASAKFKDSTNESDATDFINPIEARAENGVVTVIHHDAKYQCDANVIFMLQANDNTLVLTEVPEVDVVTDCKCNMDLSVELLNLLEGQIYHIEVWNQYHTVLFGSVDVRLGDCPEELQCETAEDCYEGDLPHDDCVGSWSCNFGQCEYVCQMECASDSDCPGGYACVYYDDTVLPCFDEDGSPTPYCLDEDGNVSNRATTDLVEPIACADHADCPQSSACINGFCYYDDVPAECNVDNDCLPSMICMNGMCAYQDDVECADDSDCPVGMVCMMADNCLVDASGADCGMGYGVCVAEEIPVENWGICEPIEWECNVTEDCYGWGPEWDLDFCKADCVNHRCELFCEEFECYTDSECPEGQRCEYYNYAYPEGIEIPAFDEEDGSADTVIGVIGGYCVSNDPINSCFSIGGECLNYTTDFSCPEGWIPAYELYMTTVDLCGGNGTLCCIPKGLEPVCETDDDCYQYFGNDIEADGSYENWGCVNGICQIIDNCKYECQSDSDCGYNGRCIYKEIDPNTNCGGSYCDSDEPICDYVDANGQCRCGGFVGYSCPDSYECTYLDDCDPANGGADCLGYCEPKVCGCYEVYQPVCGVNGKTYGNDCEASCAGVQIAYAGECKEDFCYSSEDCASGQICSVDLGDCGTLPECDDPNVGCPTVCVGVCYDYNNIQCSDDVSCPYGMHCENGLCVEHGMGLTCTADDECPEGYFCDSCPPYPGCPECDACGSPTCMPIK